MVKNLPASTGDVVSVPALGRPPGGGNGTPLQYFCLGNPMDRGAWQALVYGVARVRHGLATTPPPSPRRAELRLKLHCFQGKPVFSSLPEQTVSCSLCRPNLAAVGKGSTESCFSRAVFSGRVSPPPTPPSQMIPRTIDQIELICFLQMGQRQGSNLLSSPGCKASSAMPRTFWPFFSQHISFMLPLHATLV